MDPNLVSSPRFQLCLQKREISKLPLERKYSMRRHTVSLHPDPPLAISRRIFMQRQLNMLTCILPIARYEREITFTSKTITHLLMQISQCSPFFCDQQQTRSFAVKPVNQFQKFCFRTGRTQLFNHTITHARSTMDRDASRLIND